MPLFITRNLRLKLLAVLLSMFTWAGVVYASNPPDTRTVTVPVPQESQTVAPWVLVHPIPDIAVRVSGTRDHINAFTPQDLSIAVSFHSITGPGLQKIPISITNNDHDVSLVDPPDTVDAAVDRLTSASLVVSIAYTSPPPQGYVTGQEQVTPASVSVIGPEQLLKGVQAKVNLNFSNQKTNFEAELPVVLYDAIGNRLGNLGVIPSTVRVSITVNSSLTSRSSAVVPQVSGSVAPGFQLTGISIDPPTVVLNGPQDLLNTLDSIPTASIDITGLTGDRTYTVKIVTPSGVTAAPGTVTVRVHVVQLPQATPTPSPTPAPTPTPTP